MTQNNMQNMQNNLVITNNDEISPEEAISVARDLRDGFDFYIQGVIFKSTEFSQFIDAINIKIEEIPLYDYSRDKNVVFKKYLGESIKIYARGNSSNITVTILTKTEELSKEIWDLYNLYSKTNNSVQIFIHSFFMERGYVNDTSRIILPEEFKYLSPHYYPYINIDVMFDKFFTESENILLVVGEPGLGKSKMSTLALKYAFNNSDKLPYDKLKDNDALENQYINVAYVKSTEVLQNDSFWRKLEGMEMDFCIIDDLDYMLTRRDSEVQSQEDIKKNEFLNQFLSYTDGVENHKTKFIITTNQNYDDIDTALLRKGRLFDILELRHLTIAEALNIWIKNKLDKTIFDNIFKGKDVLPADLGSEITKRLNTRITTETSTTSYLLESDISKVQKASRTKKIRL